MLDRNWDRSCPKGFNRLILEIVSNCLLNLAYAGFVKELFITSENPWPTIN